MYVKIIIFIITCLVQLYAVNPAATPFSHPVRVPILMYHHIQETSPGDDKMLRELEVSPLLFKKHLQLLRDRGYTAITFIDLQNYFMHSVYLPPKLVILTFDDGYDDNWHAFEILWNMKMKGVFFVALSTLNTPGHLTTAQLVTMYRDGMEIGSHSINHVDLRHIRKDKSEREILLSQQKLEELLNVPVISFSYPGGRYNNHMLQVLEHSSYWFARTTRPGISTIQGKNFKLHTLRITQKTTVSNLNKLLGN